MKIDEEYLDSKSLSRYSNSPSHLNDFYKSFASRQSTQSVRDYSTSEYSHLKLIYIIITIINTTLGIYSTFKHSKILIEHAFKVYFYLISYTFLWPIAIIIGLILSGIILILKRFLTPWLNLKTNENEDDFNNNNYYSYLIIILIIVLVSFYTLSIPLSVYMIYSLAIKKLFYYDYRNYVDLYLFIFLNFLKSIGILSFVFYNVFKKKFRSERLKIDLDEEFIKQVQCEVEQANKYSGIISADSKLIKLNSMFNRQYYPSNKQISSQEKDESGKQEINETNDKNNSEFNLNNFKKEHNISILNSNYSNFQGSMEDKKTKIKSFIKQSTMNNENNSHNNSLIKNFKTHLEKKEKNKQLSRSPYITRQNKEEGFFDESPFKFFNLYEVKKSIESTCKVEKNKLNKIHKTNSNLKNKYKNNSAVSFKTAKFRDDMDIKYNYSNNYTNHYNNEESPIGALNKKKIKKDPFYISDIVINFKPNKLNNNKNLNLNDLLLE